MNLSLSVYAYDGVSSGDAEQALVTPIDLHQAYVEYLSPVGLWRLEQRTMGAQLAWSLAGALRTPR